MPGGQHGASGACLPSGERRGQRCRGDERSLNLRAGPAGLVAACQSPHRRECCPGDERGPGHIDRTTLAPALRDHCEDEHDRQQPDGNVDPEHPLPRQLLGHHSAHHRPRDDCEPGDALERADRCASLLDRRCRDDHRQTDRQHDGPAPSLDDPGAEQEPDAGRQCREGRSDDEHPEPDDEHSSTPEPIAEGRPGHQHRRERHAVGSHGPLQVRRFGAEGAAHGVERRRDDEEVQRHHERRDRRHRQDRREAASSGWTGRVGSLRPSGAARDEFCHGGGDPPQGQESSRGRQPAQIPVGDVAV